MGGYCPQKRAVGVSAALHRYTLVHLPLYMLCCMICNHINLVSLNEAT